MNTHILLGILAFLWPVYHTAAYSDHIKMISTRHDLGRSTLLKHFNWTRPVYSQKGQIELNI